MRGAILSSLSVVGVLALTAGCESTHHAADTTAQPSTVVASGSTAQAAPSGSGPASPASTPAVSPSSTKKVKPVPAPGGRGNISQTVPSRAVTTEPPVRIGQPASTDNAVSITATAVNAITAKARQPGEISGPAIEVVLRFSSGSRAVGLEHTVVTVAGTNGDQGTVISGSPADPVPDNTKLAPHSTVTGRYVFTLARSNRSHITINASYSPSAPVVIIVGKAAR